MGEKQFRVQPLGYLFANKQAKAWPLNCLDLASGSFRDLDNRIAARPRLS